MHLMQPLDVAVFAPMKQAWRSVLSNCQKLTKICGPFPFLLQHLHCAIKETMPKNLELGFQYSARMSKLHCDPLNDWMDAAHQQFIKKNFFSKFMK